MPLNLTKVAFGCRDVDSLKARVSARAVNGEIRIATRMRPRRAAELVGGHLFWIVKHRLVGGLEILRFEDRDDGRIDIICAADLVPCSPVPCRAHQGWRYLSDADSPLVRRDSSGVGELPARLYGRLAALALV